MRPTERTHYRAHLGTTNARVDKELNEVVVSLEVEENRRPT